MKKVVIRQSWTKLLRRPSIKEVGEALRKDHWSMLESKHKKMTRKDIIRINGKEIPLDPKEQTLTYTSRRPAAFFISMNDVNVYSIGNGQGGRATISCVRGSIDDKFMFQIFEGIRYGTLKKLDVEIGGKRIRFI